MAGKKDRAKLSDETRALIRNSLLIGICCIAGFAVVALGIYKVYRYVDSNVAYSAEPPKVVIKDRPVWMSDFLADQICEAARPPGAHSALDRNLLKNAKIVLQENMRTNAWIREIKQLKLEYGQRPGDTLVLDCEFRAPIALVHWHEKYYLVDGEGIALPEPYTADQISKVVFGRDGRMNIRVVEGIRSERPNLPGEHWAGADLAAALAMVKKLNGRPWAEEITKIDVSNFGGGQDKNAAWIVLYTRQSTQIRWGRPVDSTDLAEVSCAEKIRNLERIYSQYKRIDAGLPWIDVRIDSVRRPTPTEGAMIASNTR